MILGGRDIMIEVSDPLAYRERAIAIVRATWPDAVIEDADAGAPISANTYEIMAYRNTVAFLSWQLHGATDTNRDDMLYILFAGDFITCVVDGPDTSSLADQIRAATAP